MKGEILKVYIILADWSDHSAESEVVAALLDGDEAGRLLDIIQIAQPMLKLRVVDVPVTMLPKVHPGEVRMVDPDAP